MANWCGWPHGWHKKYWKGKNLPFFSFIYYIFIEGKPPIGPEDDPAQPTESLLNTVALVSALMLTIATAIPLSVDYEEMVAANARFDEGGVYACGIRMNGGDFKTPSASTHFANVSISAIYVLSGSLLMVTFLLLSLKSIEGDDTKHQVAAYKNWWWFCRFYLMIAFALLIGGVIGTVIAFDEVIRLKFPSTYVERQCTANGTRHQDGSGDTSGAHHPDGLYYAMNENPISTCVFFEAVILLPVLITGIWLGGHALVEMEPEKVDTLELTFQLRPPDAASEQKRMAVDKLKAAIGAALDEFKESV